MKQQDQLRNTLREYYDNQEAPFDDKEWERASAYLDAARQRKRIGYSLIAIGVLGTILFVLLFHSPKATTNKNLLSEQKPTPVSVPQTAIFETPLVKQSETKLQINPNESSEHSARLTPESKTHVTIRSSTTEFSHEKTTQISAIKAVEAQPIATEQKVALIEAPVIENAPVQPPAVNVVFRATDNSPVNIIKSEVPEGSIVKEETSAVPAEVTASLQNKFLTKEIPQASAEVTPPMSESIALDNNRKEIETTDATKLAGPEKAAVVTILDTSPHDLIPSTSPSTDIAMVDTATELTHLNNLAGEGIFYEAGAAWLYGWKGPSHRDARGLSPIVGIHYMNRLSRRCAFSFGLQYLQVSNLSNSSKTSRVSSYVYGEQSNVTVITPSSVYYVLAPLRFHYFLDRKNSFGMGINLAYLVNVDATVTTHDESPGFTGNYKTTKLGGYSQGFSWFDSQLAFCYRRKISESFGLQAEIFFGLKDVKQDEFFGLRNKERNSGGKLSLIYYAFRKNSR